MDIKEYWKNRKAGKRGQGEYPTTHKDVDEKDPNWIDPTPRHMVNMGRGMQFVNRKQARAIEFGTPSDPKRTKKTGVKRGK